MADEKTEEGQTRITIPMTTETEQLLRDASMIFGIKPAELIDRALSKYIEAVQKQAGSEFKTAMDAIKKVRALNV